MERAIYLDYNATTPIDYEVKKAMLPYFDSLFGNPSSLNALGIKNKLAIENARKQVAHTINANANEIVFTSGGTEANNHALFGAAFANKERGRHIITSQIEHPAIIEVCRQLEKLGWDVTYIPVDNKGCVNPTDIENAVRKDTVLISIMHANNEVGSIQPIAEIGEIAKKHNVLFHTDSAQSLGKISVDIQKLNVDLLSIAGHKIYAPKGIGALYIKQGSRVSNLIFGAGQENGFRPGTENVPYIVALGKACEIAQRDFSANIKQMLHCKNQLLAQLKIALNNKTTVNLEHANTLPNTLSIAFKGFSAHELVESLKNKVVFSAGSACHAGSINISQVLKALKIDQTIAQSTVRISTGKHTTESEIEHAAKIISSHINKHS